MMDLPEIVVTPPALDDPFTVRYQLACTGSTRRYFSAEPMFVRYDVDVRAVPESILLIPLLGTLVPIAWVLGATLHVPVIDEAFLEALPVIRRSFQRLHPTIDWTGDVRAETIATETANPGHRTALLFSGGVDSLASYVSHRQENPLLVSVWGADIGLSQPEKWEQVSNANGSFARTRGTDISFIATNFRTFFRHGKLRADFLASFPNWYSGAQQGLGLVTLCAPLSHTHGVRKVLISSTQPDRTLPWGSHPNIENNVRWGATVVSHDGAPLSRQAKMEIVAEHIRRGDPKLPIRACWGQAANCSNCVKCWLTMIGLLLEGLDANQHGFHLDAATLAKIRRILETGRMPLSEHAARFWTELQRAIPQRKPIDIAGLGEFWTWLEAVSIERSRQRSSRRMRSLLRQFLERQPEPVGRWIRRARGHPFP